MNRYKFKAWNKAKKQWIHEEPCDLLGETILLGAWLQDTPIQEFDDVVILQSTGMNDKNGKLICEGDIVKADFGLGNPLQAVELETFFWCKGECIVNADSIEVIGNIYNNPEMVTGRV